MKTTAFERIRHGGLALRLTCALCALVFPGFGQEPGMKQKIPEPHSFEIVKLENFRSGKQVVRVRFFKKPEMNRGVSVVKLVPFDADYFYRPLQAASGIATSDEFWPEPA